MHQIRAFSPFPFLPTRLQPRKGQTSAGQTYRWGRTSKKGETSSPSPSLTDNFWVWGRPELVGGRKLKLNKFWSFDNVLGAKHNPRGSYVVKSHWESHEMFWKFYPGAGKYKLRELVSQDGDGKGKCCLLFLPFQVSVSLLSQFRMEYKGSFLQRRTFIFWIASTVTCSRLSAPQLSPSSCVSLTSPSLLDHSYQHKKWLNITSL